MFVERLEDVMVSSATSRGIHAYGRVPGRSGAWVDGDRKIGAVGVRISGGVTTHGLAFNVSTVIPTDGDTFSVLYQ